MLNIFGVWNILGSYKSRIKLYKVLKHMLNLKGPKSPQLGTVDSRNILLCRPTTIYIFTHAVIQIQSVGLVLLGSKWMLVCSKNEKVRFEVALLGAIK